MKIFLTIWQFLFDPWEVTVIEEGSEKWTRVMGPYSFSPKYGYGRNYVKYKYTHKFFKKEKIIKKYLD